MFNALKPNRKDDQSRGSLCTSEGATYKRSGSSAQSKTICSRPTSSQDAISIPSGSRRTALEADFPPEENVQYKRIKPAGLATGDERSTKKSAESKSVITKIEWNKQLFENFKQRNSKSNLLVLFITFIIFSFRRCPDPGR
jgi:hypothetical protein